MVVELKIREKNPWAGLLQYKHCFDYIAPYFTRSGSVSYTHLDVYKRQLLYYSLDIEDNRRLYYREILSYRELYIGTQLAYSYIEEWWLV